MSTTEASSVPAVGNRHQPLTFGPITRPDILKYQGASGVFVPRHRDNTFETAAGFPTVFTVLATYATDWLGPENIRHDTMRFREQRWPDDVLTCEGVVTSIAADAPQHRVEVSVTCTRETGGVAVSASAEFVI